MEKVEKMFVVEKMESKLPPQLSGTKKVEGEVLGRDKLVEGFVFLRDGSKKKVHLVEGRVVNGFVVGGVVEHKVRVPAVDEENGFKTKRGCSCCFAGRECSKHARKLVNPFQKYVSKKPGSSSNNSTPTNSSSQKSTPLPSQNNVQEPSSQNNSLLFQQFNSSSHAEAIGSLFSTELLSEQLFPNGHFLS